MSSFAKTCAGFVFGIFVGFGLIALAGVLFLGWCSVQVSEAYQEVEQQNIQALNNLSFEILTLEEAFGDSYKVTGEVINNGSQKVGYVEIRCQLLENDVMVDERTSYAIGGGGLSPGSTKRWDLTWYNLGSMSGSLSCKCSIVNASAM